MKKMIRIVLCLMLIFMVFSVTIVPANAAWQQSGGRWWNSNSSSRGYSVGWERIGNNWYLFDKDGWMLTGWQKDSGNWYYFKNSGAMAANEWIDNYYLKPSGIMATNEWIGNYYVGVDGKWNPQSFDADKAASQIKITNAYEWKGYSYNYIAISVKNESAFTLNPTVQILFKDASGAIVSTKSDSITAFDVGTEQVCIFSTDSSYASYEIKMTAKEEKYFAPIVSSLSYTSNITDGKVVVSVSNSGAKAARFVQYTVLFMNAGKVVGYSRTYIGDADYEIKPGKTEHKESRSYETFDSVKIYLDGYAEK